MRSLLRSEQTFHESLTVGEITSSPSTCQLKPLKRRNFTRSFWPVSPIGSRSGAGRTYAAPRGRGWRTDRLNKPEKIALIKLCACTVNIKRVNLVI